MNSDLLKEVTRLVLQNSSSAKVGMLKFVFNIGSGNSAQMFFHLGSLKWFV